MKYADVILPLPLENLYTYRIPADMEAAVVSGCRVIVNFGKRRFYTAIVYSVHDKAPESDYDAKEIYALLDAMPVLRRPQLRFWEWISSYYLCKLGDVYKASLPSGLKIESETVVAYSNSFTSDIPLKPNECSVLDAFGTKDIKLTVSEIEHKTGLHNVVPVIASLLSKGAVVVSEQLKQSFIPKIQTYIRVAPALQSPDGLHAAFDSLKKARKQEKLFLKFLDMSHALNPTTMQEISKKELLTQSGESPAILNGLIKKGLLETYDKVVSRLHTEHCCKRSLDPLSDAQQKAYIEITDCFKQKDVCLLHGVTSSGKTEIYIHLIDRVIKSGRQVLYLLPEIAITTQITERLGRLFGDRMLVYHSKFSDNERVEVWNRLLHDKSPLLILGVRSSIFLPFADLGLIIVDEEHETSYKQQEPAPRYNARNAAMVLAGMHGGKILLGSATPSIESFFNANNGRYGYVELTNRYGDCKPPLIIPVNVKELKRKKIMKNPIVSPVLAEEMQKALGQGEQVILFQNRRGFAPLVECKECGWVPRCVNCDVSMTYHKYQNRLVCHYCGYSISLPGNCPECGGEEIRMMGFGTEKVEEEIKNLFPDKKVQRMDLDTAKSRTAYEHIFEDFEKGKTQILIGTQMVSKGLDFSHVGVVGILNADMLMNYPDFRAHERAFQLMVQVSGRAGRRDRQGVVVLQTSQTDHPLVKMVVNYAYKDMVVWQLSERSQFRYPPYYRLIVLVMRSKKEIRLNELSRTFAEKLRGVLADRVLGPVTPPVSFVQTYHIRKVIIKVEAAASIQSMRVFLERTYRDMQQIPDFNRILVHYDVDPQQ